MIQRETKDINKLKNLSEVIQRKENKIITIAGLSKNAGKTSFLNYILNRFDHSPAGVTTTGHDGEDTDLITSLKKPKVILPQGTYFSSIPDFILHQMPYLETIKKTDFRVIGKNLYIFKTTRKLETEIVGPATVNQQIQLAEEFIQLGVKTVFIDGSLDRKSIALSPLIKAIVIVASPVFGDINELIEELQMLKNKFDIPVTSLLIEQDETLQYRLNNKIVYTDICSLIHSEKRLIQILDMKPEWIFIPSVITDIMFHKIKKNLYEFKGIIIIKNPLNFMIQPADFTQLIRNIRLECLFKAPLTSFVINSFSVGNQQMDADILREQVRKNFKEPDIFDIQEAEIQ